MEVIFVDFAVSPPFDGYLHYPGGLLGIQVFFQELDKGLLGQGAAWFFFQLLANPRDQWHMGQQLLTKDFLAQRLAGLHVTPT